MNNKQKKKSGLQTAISVIGLIFCIIFGFMLLCNLTIIVKGTIHPETPPSIFGVTPLVVQSGSMSGDAPDHIEVGDLIFIGNVNTADLRENDVIAFMENKTVITHRIVSVKTDENGKLLFTTKGDANSIEDNEPVSAEKVVGIYKGRIPMLGDFAMFLQQPLGMILFIGVPLLAFIIYDIIRRQKNARKENKNIQELEEELQRLRELTEENGQETSSK